MVVSYFSMLEPRNTLMTTAVNKRTHTVAATYVGDWGGRAPKARLSSAVGARIEAPKAPRGVGCGEGVSPSPLGMAPSPEKFSLFELEKVSFGAFWVLLLQLN